MTTCSNCGYQEKDANAQFCRMCGTQLHRLPATIQRVIYLNGDADDLFNDAQKIGLPDDACRTYSRTLYEIGIVVEIDTRTGRAEMVGVEEENSIVQLERKIEV